MDSAHARTTGNGEQVSWIHVWSEELGEAWRDPVDSATSFRELQEIIESEWKPIAADALYDVSRSSEDEWDDFKRGLELEHKREFAGDEWARRWGRILLPDVVLQVVMATGSVGASMPVPVAVDRLAELGVLREVDGQYVLHESCVELTDKR
jgi:hypothetical protein